MPPDGRSREQRITAAFIELADMLVGEVDTIDYLTRLTRHCASLLDITAAGVLVTDGHGTLNMVAASSEQTLVLEILQLQSEEGPCMDTFTGRRAVSCADLRGEAERWPAFTPSARTAGYRAAHGLPMRLQGEVLGTLNLFNDTAGALPSRDVRLAQALADHATLGLLGPRKSREGQLTQLHGALHNRITIEQAKGMLAELRSVTIDDAAAVISRFARAHNRSLADVANAVVQDSQDVRGLTSPW